MRASWIDLRPYQEVDSIDWPEIRLKSAECERVMRANNLDWSEIALRHQCERTLWVLKWANTRSPVLLRGRLLEIYTRC
jgi:hypothetical protein